MITSLLRVLVYSVLVIICSACKLNIIESDNSSPVVTTSARKAANELDAVMDQYQKTFDVYTDQDSAGNHFVPSGFMGINTNVINLNTNWSDNCHSGLTCIRTAYTTLGDNWAGIYWQSPENNWGDKPVGGYDLSNANELTFWARGEKGGEKIQFFMGGITGDYGDSINQVTTPYIVLSIQWQKYHIDLSSSSGMLDYIIGGFGWVTDDTRNPQGAVFYLDDIQYQLNAPYPQLARFIQSYKTIQLGSPDRSLANVAFLYDNALALLAYLAMASDTGNTNAYDNRSRAQHIADAIVYAQNNDRCYQDGRLRNAYVPGDLYDIETKYVRLPGHLDFQSNAWEEDSFQIGTQSGNLAWAIIALATYYKNVEQPQGVSADNSVYLKSAINLGNWLISETRSTVGAGGFTGGFEYDTCGTPPIKFTWKSTEQNIDIYAAFMLLSHITSDPIWETNALHAKTFIDSMWQSTDGHFQIGTLDDGVTVNQTSISVDAQSLATLAFNDYFQALIWAERNCVANTDGFIGFDYNSDRDGIWFEGTAQMIVAYWNAGQTGRPRKFLKQLRLAQAYANNADESWIVAASHDDVSTGFADAHLYNRLHLAATAWFIFAEMKLSPFDIPPITALPTK